jgi:hypothetical protein
VFYSRAACVALPLLWVGAITQATLSFSSVGPFVVEAEVQIPSRVQVAVRQLPAGAQLSKILGI